MDISALILMMKNYLRFFPLELEVIGRFIQLFQMPDFTHQHRFPAHLVVSTWVTNVQNDKALLIFDAEPEIWCQPGGHVLSSDQCVETACRRNLAEETGYQDANWQHGEAMDLNIQKVSASGSEPQHEHYDIRLWFQVESEELTSKKPINQLMWMTLQEIKQCCGESVVRMAEKTMERER